MIISRILLIRGLHLSLSFRLLLFGGRTFFVVRLLPARVGISALLLRPFSSPLSGKAFRVSSTGMDSFQVSPVSVSFGNKGSSESVRSTTFSFVAGLVSPLWSFVRVARQQVKKFVQPDSLEPFSSLSTLLLLPSGLCLRLLALPVERVSPR